MKILSLVILTPDQDLYSVQYTSARRRDIVE